MDHTVTAPVLNNLTFKPFLFLILIICPSFGIFELSEDSSDFSGSLDLFTISCLSSISFAVFVEFSVVVIDWSSWEKKGTVRSLIFTLLIFHNEIFFLLIYTSLLITERIFVSTSQ